MSRFAPVRDVRTPLTTTVALLPVKWLTAYSRRILDVMLFPALGPRQNFGFACGNDHRASIFEPTCRKTRPPRPLTFRVFAHVCSWYGDVSLSRCLVRTRSASVPFSATSARPGTVARPWPFGATDSVTVPFEIEVRSAVWVWNVSVALAFTDTILNCVDACRAAAAGSTTNASSAAESGSRPLTTTASYLLAGDRKLSSDDRGYDQPVVELAHAHPTTAADLAVETGLLSVIIPVYNEEHHVAEVIRRVRDVPLPKEIIVVDDGSTDRTLDELERERERQAGDVVVVHQAMVNMGKGTAVRIGLKYARGDVILIQDSDLEYDPNDYPALVDPIRRGDADVVYGDRFHRRVPGMRFKYRLANWILAAAASALYGQRIRDEATAYKVFRRDVILPLDLHASRFELCPELTAKVRKAGYRIHHVPIRYQPRTLEQGKKIRLRDGFHALWTLVWYRFAS